MNSNDRLVFADESDEVEADELPPWKLLIVDDEPDVHSVTRMVLHGFRFDGRGLTFISAYDGESGLQQLRENPDIAMVLLDVVMETDNAGLRAAKAIREELNNQLVRIVLRTGQPGQAPEERVVLEYDINDYKAKTELTAARLFTTVASALRAYRDMQRLQNSRRGLQKIVESAASLFSLQSLHGFLHGVLEQMTSLMPLSEASMVLGESALAADPSNGKVVVLAGTGAYQDCEGEVCEDQIAPRVLDLIRQAMSQRGNRFEGDACALYIEGPRSGRRFVVYLEGYTRVDERERTLVNLFCQNLAVAFDNARRFEESQAARKSIVARLDTMQERLRGLVKAWRDGKLPPEEAMSQLNDMMRSPPA